MRRLLTSQLPLTAASAAPASSYSLGSTANSSGSGSASAAGDGVTPTLGVDMFTLEQTVDGARRTLCLWDCAGQERLRPIVQQVLPHAKVRTNTLNDTLYTINMCKST